MAITKRTERDEDYNIHEFTLNQQEKENFIKMMKPFNFDEIGWSESMGFSDTHKCLCFGKFKWKVFDADTIHERTERYSDMEAVKNWRNYMNSKGWSWVNENVEELARVDRISPMAIVKYIKKLYGYEPEFRPYTKYNPALYFSLKKITNEEKQPYQLQEQLNQI